MPNLWQKNTISNKDGNDIEAFFKIAIIVVLNSAGILKKSPLFADNQRVKDKLRSFPIH
jgi:hypothetical protein